MINKNAAQIPFLLELIKTSSLVLNKIKIANKMYQNAKTSSVQASQSYIVQIKPPSQTQTQRKSQNPKSTNETLHQSSTKPKTQ